MLLEISPIIVESKTENILEGNIESFWTEQRNESILKAGMIVVEALIIYNLLSYSVEKCWFIFHIAYTSLEDKSKKKLQKSNYLKKGENGKTQPWGLITLDLIYICFFKFLSLNNFSIYIQ